MDVDVEFQEKMNFNFYAKMMQHFLFCSAPHFVYSLVFQLDRLVVEKTVSENENLW